MARPSPEAQRELNRRARVQQAREDAPEPTPLRHEGDPGDPAPPVVLPKRLTIVQLDGKVDVIDLDPVRGAYMSVERQEPVPGAPWTREQVSGRYGLFSVRSLVLEEIDQEEE